MDIKQKLASLYAAPLADNYKRRIIFWQDPDGEFGSCGVREENDL